MESTMGLLALALMASFAFGQVPEGQANANEAKYNEKLKKEFVSSIPWEQSLARAQERAAAEGKLIFGYFTRSYAP